MKEHRLNPNDFILDEIESIELIGELPTVDITVEDTHMFFANDIYTHNSAHEEDIIQAGRVADSYRKIMTGDFIMSLSRKMEDKIASTGRIYIIKNRFGPDGDTFPIEFDTSIGVAKIYEKDTPEGRAIMARTKDVDQNIQDILKAKWNEHKANGGAGTNED